MASGMALIAVLWLVAALSIMVTGVVNAVRSEVRMVSLAKQSAQGGAAGDAAIHIVLQAAMATPDKYLGKLLQVPVSYQGMPIQVELRPLNGLIDLNNAPIGLLQSAYLVAGGLDARQAEWLAQATVDARTRKDSSGKAMGFEAVEDLLSVPGMAYPLYAKLKPLVTAGLGGGGKVNPLAAPEGVLSVLAGGNASSVANLVAARASGGIGLDTSGLNASFTDNAVVQRLMLTARVSMPDGTSILNSRYVDLTANPLDGVPWRTFQTERMVGGVSEKIN